MGQAGKERRDWIKFLNVGFFWVLPGQQRIGRWGMAAAVLGMLAVCVPAQTRAVGSKRGPPPLTPAAVQRLCLRGGGVPGARAMVSTPPRASVPCWSVSEFRLRLSLCARPRAACCADRLSCVCSLTVGYSQHNATANGNMLPVRLVLQRRCSPLLPGLAGIRQMPRRL